jgi:predicted metal-binding protein
MQDYRERSRNAQDLLKSYMEVFLLRDEIDRLAFNQVHQPLRRLNKKSLSP